jgi:uncharacterized protein (DUF58 family)
MIELPAPGVRFEAGLLRRVEAFAPRVAAARERREGAGNARLDGAGLEFVGRRPYRPGDDPRLIDWELLARDDRPWVRVLHREAVERWAVVLDVSASMGVGPPGKLQSAAEVALAIAAVAVRARAQVTLHTTADPDHPFVVRRPADVPRVARRLEAVAAGHGAPGLGVLRDRVVAPPVAGRVVLLGDLWDLTAADVARVQRPGREVVVGRVLAPAEMDPGELGLGAARFVDPEDGSAVTVRFAGDVLGAYGRALEEELEGLERALARRRVRSVVWRSDAPFETPALRLVGG